MESLEDLTEENREWAAAFAQLHNAARPEPDPVPDVQDTRQNLAKALARLSQVLPQPPLTCMEWMHSVVLPV